jgi:hypothetical protein
MMSGILHFATITFRFLHSASATEELIASLCFFGYTIRFAAIAAIRRRIGDPAVSIQLLY